MPRGRAIVKLATLGATVLAALVGCAAGSTDGVAVAAAGAAAGTVVAASGTDAVVSGLKSLMLTGGRFTGSGRGIAASIASSAALLRAGLACASAEVADTVRKVAATAIRTRSNPARLVEQSRIVTPLGETAPSWNSPCIVYRPSQLSPACNYSHADGTRATDKQPVPRGQLTTN